MTTIASTPAARGGRSLPDRNVVPAVWARYSDIVVDHGEGSWLISVDGDRYLDYTSGIGVTNTGHAHPRVVRAIQDQAARLLHGQQNIVYHEAGLRLHERLAHLLPGDGWGAFLSNSGSEAVEGAVKLARVATGRPAIVAFQGGFHGRTHMAAALTSSRVTVRSDAEPLPGPVYRTTYPYCYRSPRGQHPIDSCTCDWEQDLETLFAQLVPAARVAAVVVEPVIGEGGYIVPPPGFLPRLREITREHGILLVADEVQTGFGRTGELFAVRHADVQPDILIMAKGLASGLPLSGLIARRELIDRWSPGAHGGTYGGNVVACAAANATIDVIEEEGLVANARERGRQLLDGLRALQPQFPALGDVRGQGCMVGLEFVKPGAGDGRVPSPEATKAVLAAALERRLILLSAGTWGQVVRLIPPLVTTREEVDLALGVLAEALESTRELA